MRIAFIAGVSASSSKSCFIRIVIVYWCVRIYGICSIATKRCDQVEIISVNRCIAVCGMARKFRPVWWETGQQSWTSSTVSVCSVGDRRNGCFGAMSFDSNMRKSRTVHVSMVHGTFGNTSDSFAAWALSLRSWTLRLMALRAFRGFSYRTSTETAWKWNSSDMNGPSPLYTTEREGYIHAITCHKYFRDVKRGRLSCATRLKWSPTLRHRVNISIDGHWIEHRKEIRVLGLQFQADD